MFYYFYKFNKLDPKLRLAVSSPEAVGIIDSLERKYNVDMASLIMRVMVKDIDIDTLPLTIFTEFNLGQAKSEELAEELKRTVFRPVSNYLGFSLEEDVMVEKVDAFSKDHKEKYSKKVKELSEDIVRQLNLGFKDEAEKIKFLSLLEKYIRGVKDIFSVRQTFLKEVSGGGLGLSDKMVESIFQITKESEKNDYDKAKVDLKIKNEVLDKINKLSHGKIKSELDVKMLPPEDFSHELPEKTASSKIIVEKKIEEPKIVEKKEAVVERPKVAPPSLPLERNGKVKMTEVKKVRVSSPVDELRYMDLVNFRRLAENPEEAFKKIKQKIELLREVDYSKMIEGIKAWRQSPVNRMYLKIFSKASDTGMSIDQILAKLEASKQDHLKKAEIEALISFNKSLLF